MCAYHYAHILHFRLSNLDVSLYVCEYRSFVEYEILLNDKNTNTLLSAARDKNASIYIERTKKEIKIKLKTHQAYRTNITLMR